MSSPLLLCTGLRTQSLEAAHVGEKLMFLEQSPKTAHGSGRNIVLEQGPSTYSISRITFED
jgi:hypothetical protein